MADRKARVPASRTPDVYLKLIRRFPLRPIRSQEDLDQAIAMINSLLDRTDLAPAEEDYLDVLGDLVERYESKEGPIEDASVADVMQELIEARGLDLPELARATNIALSTLSVLSSGKRSPSRAQVVKLARFFHVDPKVFATEHQ